ncbi:hypothetical protein [Lentzea sp. NPDC059081]|uniref:hypothetical protein n=1 Tax=Lentzea sp. NPDC059081 TaxID=3346719 RepID=UPI0036C656B4
MSGLGDVQSPAPVQRFVERERLVCGERGAAAQEMINRTLAGMPADEPPQLEPGAEQE